MASRYYRPELDALRFFAFASVFCDHVPIDSHWYQPIQDAGAFGMCMFFLLSAYLIITILLREKETIGTVDLGAFFARRALRIWPLYFLVLFAGYFFGLHYRGSATVSKHALLAFSFLLGNVYVLFYNWLGPINALWSLSVEEQFYIAVPAIVRMGGRRGVIVIGVAAITISYLVLLHLGLHHAVSRLVWANSFVQFQFFAAGGLLALWLYHRAVVLSLQVRMAMAAAGIILWFVGGSLFHVKEFLPLAPAPLLAGFFAVLIGTSMIFLSVINMNLRIPQPFIYLGKISYGLYLFHGFFLWGLFETSDRWPCMTYFPRHKLVSVPLALGLTIATAAFSYHFFERPILQFKQRFETIKTRPA
ncbi:MAG: acyltransferase [Acidobacteriaceae bacterium]